MKYVPERGRIGIFNRSYYEETLVVRVHREFLEKETLPPELLNKDIWKERRRIADWCSTLRPCSRSLSQSRPLKAPPRSGKLYRLAARHEGRVLRAHCRTSVGRRRADRL